MVALYYIIPGKLQWAFLLLCSFSIYTLTSPAYTVFLAITIVVTYLAALGISNIENKVIRKCVFIIPMLTDLSLLIYAKYTGFLFDIIKSILKFNTEGNTLNIIVPMGVSFYTFQSVAYLIDVYKKKTICEKNFFKFALFISYFPQLVQGPISRFNDLKATLFTPHKPDTSKLAMGSQRILWGYFKKLVLADRIYILVNTLSADPLTYNGGWYALLAILYTLELYADFSGGIDIMIGLSEMLGIDITENFLRPFFSENVARFWNRWHITMGSWFRDYIYIPLGGSRVSLSRLIFNYFIVWLTTGIWHGAGWNYIIWGLLNFTVIASSKLLEKPYQFVRTLLKCNGKKWYKAFCYIRTWLFASLFFTMFAYSDFKNAFTGFASMFKPGSFKMFTNGEIFSLSLSPKDFIVIALGFVLVLIVEIIQENNAIKEKATLPKEEKSKATGNHAVRNIIHTLPYPVRVIIWLLLFISIILLGAYGRGYDAAQFIYNRF